MMLIVRKFLVGAALLAAMLVLGACGAKMSGEPEVVREAEIEALPATNTPLPTVPPTDAPPSATPDPAASPAPTSDAPASSLDLAAADVDRGLAVFTEQCNTCHGPGQNVGPSLRGMGERAATRIEGMSAADYLHESIVNPSAYLVEGYEDVMPGYGDRLSEQQIADVVKFLLEFNLEAMIGSSGAEPTSAPAALAGIEQETVLTVRGRLVQGTPDGPAIPAGLTLQLFVLDVHGDAVGEYEGTSAADGGYQFDDVARAQGNVYFLGTRYHDVLQGAQLGTIQGSEAELVQDVTLYERTTDPSTVAITQAQMLINYAPIQEAGLEVWLTVEVANTGSRIVTTEETILPDTGEGDPRYVSVTMELPVGAFGIQVVPSDLAAWFDIRLVDGVPVVKDMRPLRPGQIQTIRLAYYVPYETGAVLDQSFSYPVVDATVLLPNDTVEMRSEQFDTGGEWLYHVAHGGVTVEPLAANERIDPEDDFTLVKAHPLLKPVPEKERVIYELVGRPTRTLDLFTADPTTVEDEGTNTLAIVLGAVGLAVIVLAGVLWWRQRRTTPALPAPGSRRPPEVEHEWTPPGRWADRPALLKAVAGLDDLHDAGRIDTETYQEERALLLERLLALPEE